MPAFTLSHDAITAASSLAAYRRRFLATGKRDKHIEGPNPLADVSLVATAGGGVQCAAMPSPQWTALPMTVEWALLQ